MLFSSITFIYFFLPVTLVISFLTPKKYKNLVLLIASFLFYAWGALKYCILLAGMIILGYGTGRILMHYKTEEGRSNRNRKVIIGMALILLTGSLIICKYVPWLSIIGNKALGDLVPALKWVMPIGISFYTFQMISYVSDVYTGRIEAETDIIKLATYISMFPQLIAGPIVRYETVREELNQRDLSWDKFGYGVRRFIIGLAKKVLLADILGELVAGLKGMSGMSPVMYWVFMMGFSLQLYLDFSGYSDMAIGLGSMLGFYIPENFTYPFIAKSITEFWRRWHISLSSWFRDYVYIPLGGNRVGKVRFMINMLIVWGLSGLWHGAGGHFLTWGIYFGVWLIVEKLWLGSILERLPAILLHLYTLIVVIISFVFFQMDTMGDAMHVIAGMFGLETAQPEAILAGNYIIRKYMVIFMIGCLASTPFAAKLVERIKRKSIIGKKVIMVLEPIVLLGLLILVTAFLLNSTFHPFLYFRF